MHLINQIQEQLYVMMIYLCNLCTCRSRFEQGCFTVQSCCARQRSAVRAAVDLNMCGTKHWSLTLLFVTCRGWPASVSPFTPSWTKWRNRDPPRTPRANTRLSARQGKWWGHHAHTLFIAHILKQSHTSPRIYFPLGYGWLPKQSLRILHHPLTPDSIFFFFFFYPTPLN